MREFKNRMISMCAVVALFAALTITASINQKNLESNNDYVTGIPGAGVVKALVYELEPGIEHHTVDMVQQAPTEVGHTAMAIPSMEGQYYVNTWSLNIRSGPGLSYSVLKDVGYGSELTINNYTVSNDGVVWGKVDLGDKTGYVSANYLSKDPVVEYMGEFLITYYCPCPLCCGKWSGYGKTASGTTPTEGRTIAADKSIPFGTRLLINGVEYIVEDRGGKITGNHIDIYLNSHSDCLKRSVDVVPVFKEL